MMNETAIYAFNQPFQIGNQLVDYLALEEQQRVTKEIEEKRQRAEEERKKLERERVEAEKRASQIANSAKDEKDRMVSTSIP
jgi:hypothetical protein